MLLKAPKIKSLKDEQASAKTKIDELKLAIGSEVSSRKNLTEKDKQLQTEVIFCASLLDLCFGVRYNCKSFADYSYNFLSEELVWKVLAALVVIMIKADRVEHYFVATVVHHIIK